MVFRCPHQGSPQNIQDKVRWHQEHNSIFIFLNDWLFMSHLRLNNISIQTDFFNAYPKV